MSADRVGAVGDRVVDREHRLDRLGLRHHAEGQLRDHAERPLRTDHQAGQIESGIVERLAADFDHLAVIEDDLGPEDMVARHAVLEAVGAAGVLPQVAGDRGRLFAGGVRVVEIAVFADRPLDVQRDRPRLHHDPLVLHIDLEDPVHPGEEQRDSALRGGAAAAEIRPGAAGHDRYPVLTCKFDHLGYLLRGGGHHDAVGPSPVEGGVISVELEFHLG